MLLLSPEQKAQVIADLLPGASVSPANDDLRFCCVVLPVWCPDMEKVFNEVMTSFFMNGEQVWLREIHELNDWLFSVTNLLDEFLRLVVLHF